VDEFSVDPRIVLCDLFGDIGEVVLDRAALASPEIYEQRPSPRVEHVSRMRLTVQQLLAGARTLDRSARAPECSTEQFAVTIAKSWSQLFVANILRPTGDSFGDVWCLQTDLAQAGMEPHERLRIDRCARSEDIPSCS
jgi:hypothetical protein